MTILHSGTTKQYSENWDTVFGGKRKKSAKAKPSKTAKKKSAASTKKRPAKKKKRK